MQPRSSETTGSAAPSRAGLTFRVGIVGHRPNRLQREDIPSLTARLAEALSLVKQAVEDFPATHPGLFEPEPARLRAVSSLAEGTDRYFAREALRLGYQLCCPMPFRKEEFENDFKPEKSLETGLDSVAEFNQILNEAQKKTGLTVLELEGLRTHSAGAYAVAGRVVLEQSDLLMVVWDGGGGNKRGGTVATMQEALAGLVPVLWIDARAPHRWQLLERASDLPVWHGERCVPSRLEPADLVAMVERTLKEKYLVAAPSVETRNPGSSSG